ncbi:FmdE family protein [Sulfurimonas sp.]|uniref:FmdE family protein n=1 Tax=Sulfurimonas sp. TaxID=2022749 RepID=UPI0035694818
MKYPEFFDTLPTITLKDELAEFLGSIDDGIVEFSYLDVVKNAGHSCPTVAGAYIMTLVGLKELYKDETPVRGEIVIEYASDENDGVAGIISNVMSQITGATKTLGFKGIGGEYIRHSLVSFNALIDSSVKFKRNDTNESVEITYNPDVIKPDPAQAELMQKLLRNFATDEEAKEFKKLWQGRVKKIFENIDKVITIKS